MITYHQGKFIFFRSLFRVHGSALHRAIIPSLLSTAILITLEYTSYYPAPDLDHRYFTHPYPIACLLAAFTFLLTFKCSFSYNRYWEACTAIHQMQSKWLDVGMELAAFHLQSERFSNIRPQSFGQHPHIDQVVRKRERLRPMTPMQLQEMLEEEEIDDEDSLLLFEEEKKDVDNFTKNNNVDSKSLQEPWEDTLKSLSNDSKQSVTATPTKKKRFSSSIFRRRRKGKKSKSNKQTRSFIDHHGFEESSTSEDALRSINNKTFHDESHSLAAGVFNHSTSSTHSTTGGSSSGERGGSSPNQSMHKQRSSSKRLSKSFQSKPDLTGGMSKNASPSLFLQEASHLLSLLSAVAFATLRNDIESAESPLKDYIPGSPWPSVDPDDEDAYIHHDFYKISRWRIALKYLFGNDRTPTQRTVYNACRPFCVLGGVSDAEIDVLQRARGPLAKTALCTMWLQEFITREFLNGALGKVSPPIVSRLYQYTSDGMIGYNQARKVAYVPFPFPHSQLTTFFLVVITISLPILMLTFVPEVIVAAILNTLTVGVFFGLWLVANELEDPFRNVPNDIPLNNFQVQFNEALVCMFAGFHPEAWWDIDERKNALSESSRGNGDLNVDTLIGTEVISDKGNSKNVGGNSIRSSSLGLIERSLGRIEETESYKAH